MSGYARSIFLFAVVLVFAAPASAQDQIGIWWDGAYTSNQTTTSAPFEMVTGHIVISDPTVGGGILAWECQVTIDGPGTVASWNIAGQFINAQSPPRFAVGLASPLPPAQHTEVATFDMFVTEVAPLKVGLKPIFFSSLPNAMSYVGGDQPNDLVPMTTVTGSEVVATVNEDVPIAEVSRVAIQFGEVGIGTTKTEFVQVTNVGGGVLPLDIQLDCAGPGYSLPQESGPLGLTAGQSVNIDVAFTPTTTGPVECTLILGGGAPDVFMLGSGREPITSWDGPADISFGSVPIGQSRTRSTWIRNTGETTLTVNVELVNPCPNVVITSGAGFASVLPGRYHNVSVTYSPSVPGSVVCQLTFGSQYDEVLMTGQSYYASPDYTITPSFVHFPLTDVDDTRAQVVAITNTGSGSFQITPDISPGGAPFDVSLRGTPLTILPGQTQNLTVTFTPPAEEYYAADLLLGALPPLPLSGSGGDPILICNVSTDSLAFDAAYPGESASQIVVVQNEGNVSFDLIPTTDRPEFVVDNPAPVTLQPGEAHIVTVTFTATSLYHVSATLVLGPAVCSPVALIGGVDVEIQPGQNRIGFFWDTGFTAIETGLGVTNTTLPVYLALLNPSNESGVAGWECRVAVGGQAQFTSATLAGNAVNAGDPNNIGEFAVGIGLEPLPYTPDGILLATFELLVTDPDPNNVYLELHPLWQPSIPGLMAWIPWDDITDLTPMITSTGTPAVAWINTGVPVAIETPTPRATQLAGRVELSWTSRRDDVDGYHVDRRTADGLRERLTASPLPATEQVRFSDNPPFAAGTSLWYSYTAVQAGREIAVSPEVEVKLAAVPVLRTELLANVPNPFNPETRIRYRLAKAGDVRVTVYDVTGRLVRTLVDTHQGVGAQDVTWQGRDDAGLPVSSGAYYVRLESADGVDHRKIMMLK